MTQGETIQLFRSLIAKTNVLVEDRVKVHDDFLERMKRKVAYCLVLSDFFKFLATESGAPPDSKDLCFVFACQQLGVVRDAKGKVPPKWGAEVMRYLYRSEHGNEMLNEASADLGEIWDGPQADLCRYKFNIVALGEEALG